jgi:phenylalanyl-tRNA synthetase beta chain
LPGETLRTLDDVPRHLSADMLLITDGGGPVAIAGVMGGLDTEIGPATTNVLLESANFDNLNNRRTAQLLKLSSEAALRFGRGLPPETTVIAARRASELMRQVAGGVIARGVADAYPRPAHAKVIDFRPAEVGRLLGIDLPHERVVEALESLEFGCQPGAEPDTVRVTVPYYRLDVDIAADLVEEVARVVGYERIPETLLRDELPPQRRNPSLEGELRVRDILAACGLAEVITYSLTNLDSVARLVPSRELPDPDAYIRLANPLSADREFMRRTLQNALLETMADNLRFVERVAIFEIGRVYLPQPGRELPHEPRRLAMAMSGARHAVSWTGAMNGELDFYDLKGVVEALLERLELTNRTFEPATDPTFQEGRVARLVVAGQEVGLLGEVHPLVRENFGLPAQRVCLAEFDLDALLAQVPEVHYYEALSRFPTLTRDLALVVDEALPAVQVRVAILKAGGNLLRKVELFDVYRGEQVPPDKKSLAYRLAYQADDRTLTDEEVNRLQTRIEKKLAGQLGATLRA